MKLHLFNLERHRNGICGAPFHVVIFREGENDSPVMLGIVFDEPYHVAVLDIEKLTSGDIRFTSNSWRGDRYEPQLRQLIASTPDSRRDA